MLSLIAELKTLQCHANHGGRITAPPPDNGDEQEAPSRGDASRERQDSLATGAGCNSN